MGRRLTIEDRAKIVVMYDNGQLSMECIATELNVNINTVSLWINRYKQTGALKVLPGQGRHRKTSEDQDKDIINIAKQIGKDVTISEIKSQLATKDLKLSNNTIIGRLRCDGFQCGYPIIKPLLTEEHKRRRLQFAHDNCDTNWCNVIFSDETTIFKGGSRKKLWFSSETNNVIQCVRRPIKRNLYGCMTIGGVEAFKIFRTNMKSDEYMDILNETLVTIYNDKYLYQHDNCPAHKSKKATAFLERHGIKVLKNWPPNSPDLNPIENVWHLLKHELSSRIITNDNFDASIKDILENIKYECIFNIISSMHIRMLKVIQNNGDHINY